MDRAAPFYLETGKRHLKSYQEKVTFKLAFEGAVRACQRIRCGREAQAEGAEAGRYKV